MSIRIDRALLTKALKLVREASYIVYKEGNMYVALNGNTGSVEFSSENASLVVQSAINALKQQGGLIFIKDIDPRNISIADIPENVSLVLQYNGVLTYMKKSPSVSVNNFGYRSYEIVGIEHTLRLRDNTTPEIIDVAAVDSTTGDIHFFVNVSVDNMNLAGFLGRHNLPPGYRWLNRFSSPVKSV
jgi:hypothetical protein